MAPQRSLSLLCCSRAVEVKQAEPAEPVLLGQWVVPGQELEQAGVGCIPRQLAEHRLALADMVVSSRPVAAAPLLVVDAAGGARRRVSLLGHHVKPSWS